MKKFLVLLLIIFGLSCSIANAKNIKFLQVTDIHMNSNNINGLKAFVDDVNKYNDLDFVVFTGDNIDKADPKNLETFLDIIKPIKFRKYVLVGNHDLMRTNDLTKTEYMKAVKDKLGAYHSNKPNYVFKSHGIVFLTMNGVRENIPSPGGYYRQDELQWLDKMLNKYKNSKVIILQHFPLFDSHVLGHSLYKKQEYLDVLNKHNNVIAIISGHYHQNREEKIDNIYQITTKNFSNNKYYKIIEIDEETGFIFTTLIDNNKN